MYLSRIELTEAISAHSQLGLLLKDRSYGIHRLLWDLFESEERFLFREESAQRQMNRSRNLPVYYVLSSVKPTADSPVFRVDCKHFDPALQAGDRLAFKLRSNPTIKRKETGKKNSKCHDVVMDAKYQFLAAECKARQLPHSGKKRELFSALLSHRDFTGEEKNKGLRDAMRQSVEQAAVDWIKKRGENHGFELDTTQVSGYRWNAIPEKGRAAGFSSMDYEGVLTVVNPPLFLEMLARGLGRSKAFGCGLMLIRRTN